MPDAQPDFAARRSEAAVQRDHATVIATVLAVLLAVFLAVNVFRRELYAISPALYWSFDFLKFVVIPAGMVMVLARRYGIRPGEYGLRWHANREDWLHFAGLTVLLAVALYLVYSATKHVAWVILQPEAVPSFYDDINARGLARIPVTLYLSITAGVVEEIFFRGLPLLYLERRFPGAVPRRAYVLGTALAFGSIHWVNGPHEFIATFALGLAAAAIYLKLRDLWPLVAAHTLIDLYSFG